MIQSYLDAAQTIGNALKASNMDVFKNSMTHSAKALGPGYLTAMLEKSKIIQRHLL
jgi:hypothetical protein